MGETKREEESLMLALFFEEGEGEGEGEVKW
jgi:hypothetical protein